MDIRTTTDTLAAWLGEHYPAILSEFQKLGHVNFIAPEVRLDLRLFELVIGDVEVPLVPNEFKFVALLWSDPGRVFGKEEIVRAVWGTHYLHRIDDSRITKLVHRLRSKHPAIANFIRSHRGAGYKLCP